MLTSFLTQVRQRQPLVHCITNYITANDCANLLLACGASPSWQTTRRKRRRSPPMRMRWC